MISPTRFHEVGLVYLNNRYHDPTLGTFISVDPLVTTTGEAYIYASGNPITLSDPTGLDPDTGARERVQSAGGCTYSSARSCWDRVSGDPSGLMGALGYAGARQGYLRAAALAEQRRMEELERLAWASLPEVTDEQARIAAALAASPTLLPNTPPRPSDPVAAAQWEAMYGAPRENPYATSVDWDLCVIVCVPEVGYSSSHGWFARVGVGLGLETPSLVVDEADSDVPGRENTRVEGGLSVGYGGALGYGVSAERPAGTTASTVSNGKSVGLSTPGSPSYGPYGFGLSASHYWVFG